MFILGSSSNAGTTLELIGFAGIGGGGGSTYYYTLCTFYSTYFYFYIVFI